jgi:hypothetical protein
LGYKPERAWDFCFLKLSFGTLSDVLLAAR